ncbi:2-amino-4-hydroxy-6-hydroxymethyldihydropteridine diphosphokinase [Candidatus Acetothermia bacterium]|nr:2-amino-4-hydroxy-6-hydroxymethyldihydropteridine diphosphokinase [Candidatus Acetothermia bacterium]
MARAYIGLGSNVGDREVFLEKAIEMLGDSKRVKILRRAGFYETEPVGREDQPWFINTVAEIETSCSPEKLLAYTHSIELKLGRHQREHWGPREIDLDILLYENRVLDTPTLKVPHPQLHQRRFVLAPLCELAPDLIHPIFQRPLRKLLEGLSDNKQVISLRAKKF